MGTLEDRGHVCFVFPVSGLVSGRAWRGSRCEAKLSDCSPSAKGQKGSVPVGE